MTATSTCCVPWLEAQGSCTDSEAFGQLLRNYNDRWPSHEPEWRIGSDLPPVRFCPWCGARKS